MLVSVKWLEEILHIPLEIESLKRIGLNLGLEIAEVFTRAPDNAIIGKILSIEPHPNIKNLTILKIAINKKIQIVTAATNIRPGDLVLAIPAGGKLRSETVIEKNFNGIKSQGILLSEEELGLAERSSGVIVLEKGDQGILLQCVSPAHVVDAGILRRR